MFHLKRNMLAIMLLVVIGFSFTPSMVSFAQDALPTPEPKVRQISTDTAPVAATNPDFYSFVTLTQGEISMRGPFDTASFSFAVPATWRVEPQAVLQLNMSVYASGQGTLSSTGFGGLLAVRVNDQQVGTVDINTLGDRSVNIPLPAALIGSRSDGRNIVVFELDTGFSCEAGQQVNVVLRSDSGLVLPHTRISLPTNLDVLPRPIYQRSLNPDTALIVMPDSPKPEELQAVITAAAGFGRITNGQLSLMYTTASLLTEQQRLQNHLIFVGGPEVFTQLRSVAFPAPLGSANINLKGAGEDDGVIQMIASPWNPDRALLSLSGNSPQGVIKAAQALSNNAIRSYVQPNVAFVNSVKSTPENITVQPSRTFADLGYSQRTISNRSSNTAEYRFDIPAGQIVNGAALLTFTYVHSALLDPERSGVTIRLNDQPIGSVRFTNASARLTSADFTLPASLIRSGSNSIQVITDLARFASCSDRNSSDIWFTISPDSLLQIPLTQATSAGSQPFNLLSFPSTFTTQRDLSSTLFVLGQNDPVGWSNAAQIAFELGRRSNGLIAAPVAAYADALPESVRSQYHMIIVGRASRMPVITDLNAVLPAPFDAGSDFANERDIQVQYRIASDASVGYLQAIASPWADQKGILTVLGSDDLAVGASTAALLNPANRNRLTTNLTIVNGLQLISAVPALIAPVVPAIVPPTVTATPIVSQPNWIIPAIVVTGILMLLVIVVALAQRFQRQRIVS